MPTPQEIELPSLYPVALTFSGETQPEWTQIISMLISDVSLMLFEARLTDLPQWVGTGVQCGWNGLDGLFVLFNGILLLADKKNHQEKSALAKGIINVINGMQLLILSFMFGLSFGLLAAVAFAISAFFDLVNTLIDLYVIRRQLTLQGWLEEKLKKQESLDIVAARCRHYCNAGDLAGRDERVKNVEKWLKFSESGSFVKDPTKAWASADEERKDAEIDAVEKSDVEKRVKKTYQHVAFRVLNFIGMLSFALIFAAFPHIMMLVATVACTGVAIYYGYKYRNKAVDRLKASFFKFTHINRGNEEEERLLLEN